MVARVLSHSRWAAAISRDNPRRASLTGSDMRPAGGWPMTLCQVVRYLTGQRCGVEADGAQRATWRNAVPDREHAVANVACKPAARVAVHVEDAKMADQTLKISAEPGGCDDHLWCH